MGCTHVATPATWPQVLRTMKGIFTSPFALPLCLRFSASLCVSLCVSTCLFVAWFCNRSRYRSSRRWERRRFCARNGRPQSGLWVSLSLHPSLPRSAPPSLPPSLPPSFPPSLPLFLSFSVFSHSVSRCVDRIRSKWQWISANRQLPSSALECQMTQRTAFRTRNGFARTSL